MSPDSLFFEGPGEHSLPFKGRVRVTAIKFSCQGYIPPMPIGGKLNVVKQGGISARKKHPPVSLREPSPLFHRGDTAQSILSLT
jgi:hypothetical protein